MRGWQKGQQSPEGVDAKNRAKKLRVLPKERHI